MMKLEHAKKLHRYLTEYIRNIEVAAEVEAQLADPPKAPPTLEQIAIEGRSKVLACDGDKAALFGDTQFPPTVDAKELESLGLTTEEAEGIVATAADVRTRALAWVELIKGEPIKELIEDSPTVKG